MTTTKEREPEFDLDLADAQFTWQKSVGPLTRLYEDVQLAYCEGQRRCWEDCASPLANAHLVRIVNGFAYTRGAEFDDAAQERLEKTIAYQDSFGHRAAWYSEELRPQVVEIIERLRVHPSIERPYADLITHLEECIEAYATIMGDMHWRMAAGAAARFERGKAYDWPEVYEELTGRPGAEGPTLLGGLEVEMSKTIAMLRNLARIAQRDGDQSEAFRTGFEELLRRYGHRTGAGFGSSVGIGAPTWNVRPEIPLKLIATYATADIDAVEQRERDVAVEREKLLGEVREGLANDAERLARFEKEFEERSLAAWHIEDHNDWMDQSSPGIARDAAHLVGLRLVSDGVIDDPENVMHLSLDELRSPPSDARMLVAERQDVHAFRVTLEAPDAIGAEAPPMPSMMDRLVDKGDGHVGNELHGIAASSGRYTGRARVCLPSPIPPDVEDGDILIAVDAGPDWTPVFAVLGAVVLDRGAAWQHAAVVAREFGLPAVTGTKVGTTIVVDGATITVDGDTGIVELAE